MSYYNDLTKDNKNLVINGVIFPYTSKPIQTIENEITSGGRLVDSLDFEGKREGRKYEFELYYEMLNKEHFDKIWNAVKCKDNTDDEEMFFDVTIPTNLPVGIVNTKVYLGASSFTGAVCDRSTEVVYLDTGDEDYMYEGSKYDFLYRNVKIILIEK